jgi:hypothetical protein
MIKTKSPMEKIERLMHGAIDMHVHHSPESLLERRLDSLETAECAREYGMEGLVLKNREYPTAPLATMTGKLVPEIRVMGSLCLEYETGGLNVWAVETSAKLGAKVIWMPTISAMNSRRQVSEVLGVSLKGEGITILDGDRILPEVTEILKVIRDYDLVLATGHLAPREISSLFDECLRLGLPKVVVTHPLSFNAVDEHLDIERQKQLADSGAFLEQCLWSIMPTAGNLKPQEMVRLITAVGAENCIMSTDLGQSTFPPAPEGMRMFIGMMLKCGLSPGEIEKMVKVNPRRLLGL